jgi:GTP-binding protein Era
VRSGFVAVVGRPNVGKSTLVNALVGSKVSITSTRPQTTRSVIRGVMTVMDGDQPESQAVLVDTPGLHKPRTELGSLLNRLVYGTLAESDVVLFLLDATQPIGPGDRLIAERAAESGSPVVVAVNKVDRASDDEVIAQLAEAGEWDFDAYVPISALEADNLGPLIDELVSRLPEGPAYFPPDIVSDQPEPVLVAEIVREKYLDRLHDELPHSLAVVVDDMDTRADGLLQIDARVVVERDSQKGIVIGKGGSLLRTAGTEARQELERLFGTKVNLSLRVVVEREWQRDARMIERLGFGG